MSKSILAFGEVLWDILPEKKVLGGAPLNFTYRIHSLDDIGIMVSRLGQDENGDRAFQMMVDLDLPVDFIQRDNAHPTGTVNVFFDENHQPDYEIIPDVAYDFIQLDNALLRVASNADCICFGTLAQRSSVSRNTIRQILEQSNALKFLDINLRKHCFSEESIEYSIGQANILKLNSDEAIKLAEIFNFSYGNLEEFCQKITKQWHLDYCIVTLDQYGAFAGSPKECVYEPGYVIELKDSLGSGDAFSAGFIHKILHGASLQESVFFGNYLGAMVAMQDGATAPIPNEALQTIITSDRERLVHPDFLNKHYRGE